MAHYWGAGRFPALGRHDGDARDWTQGCPDWSRLCAIALTGVIAPIVPQNTELLTVTHLVAAMSSEVLLGLIMEERSLNFGAMALSARIMSMQMGHGAAMFFDPVSQGTIGPLGALASFLAMGVFLGLNIHLEFLYALSQSFYQVHPAGRVTDCCGKHLDSSGGNGHRGGISTGDPRFVSHFLDQYLCGSDYQTVAQHECVLCAGNDSDGDWRTHGVVCEHAHLVAQHVALIGSVMDLIPEILRLAGVVTEVATRRRTRKNP